MFQQLFPEHSIASVKKNLMVRSQEFYTLSVNFSGLFLHCAENSIGICFRKNYDYVEKYHLTWWYQSSQKYFFMSKVGMLQEIFGCVPTPKIVRFRRIYQNFLLYLFPQKNVSKYQSGYHIGWGYFF